MPHSIFDQIGNFLIARNASDDTKSVGERGSKWSLSNLAVIKISRIDHHTI